MMEYVITKAGESKNYTQRNTIILRIRSEECEDGLPKLLAKYMGCNYFCGNRDLASCLASGGVYTTECICEGKQLLGLGIGDGPVRCGTGCDIIKHQNAGCCIDNSHPDCCC